MAAPGDSRGRVLSDHPSAVVVPVPAAEPAVGTWRAQFDGSSARGMPAHVTALYPFLPARQLTDRVLVQLRALCASLPVLEVRFRRTGRFPDVLYLEPEPADGLCTLTAAITHTWPHTPP